MVRCVRIHDRCVDYDVVSLVVVDVYTGVVIFVVDSIVTGFNVFVSICVVTYGIVDYIPVVVLHVVLFGDDVMNYVDVVVAVGGLYCYLLCFFFF